MSPLDLGAADELRRLAGWNQTRSDWERCLALEPDGCFVAMNEGRVGGTVTTICYGQTLAWIGMMLVHPDFRRQGIGASLMRRALDYLRGRAISCVKLDATPLGLPVYEKLGFVAESSLTRWLRPPRSAEAVASDSALTARRLEASDWDAVEALDRRGFGVSRERLIRALVKAGRGAWVWPAEGSVAGWGASRAGAEADYLGPVVCSDAVGVTALTADLARDAEGRATIWDIPDENASAVARARELGFAPLRRLTRMRLGAPITGGDSLSCAAIADPSVG